MSGAQGPERFEAFIGAAVLTNNLMNIAQLLITKETKKKKSKTARARAA
jgi:hypothetical protein